MASVARMMDSVTRLRSELSAPAAAHLPSIKSAAAGADNSEQEALTAEVQSLREDLDRRQVRGITRSHGRALCTNALHCAPSLCPHRLWWSRSAE